MVLTPITNILSCASGNKKILQISKNILVINGSQASRLIHNLDQGIECIQFWEGSREIATVYQLSGINPHQLNAEALYKIAFKITYIGTALFLLTESRPRFIEYGLSGMTICGWSLIAWDAKRKLNRVCEKERPRQKCDLITSILEVIANVASVSFPILLSYAVSGSMSCSAQSFTATVLLKTPLLLNIIAKTAGLASLWLY